MNDIFKLFCSTTTHQPEQEDISHYVINYFLLREGLPIHNIVVFLRVSWFVGWLFRILPKFLQLWEPPPATAHGAKVRHYVPFLVSVKLIHWITRNSEWDVFQTSSTSHHCSRWLEILNLGARLYSTFSIIHNYQNCNFVEKNIEIINTVYANTNSIVFSPNKPTINRILSE